MFSFVWVLRINWANLRLKIRTIDLSKIDLALSIWLRVLLAKEIRCKNYTLMVHLNLYHVIVFVDIALHSLNNLLAWMALNGVVLFQRLYEVAFEEECLKSSDAITSI
uniref:Uncharacterized protein n=1 Tax=Rhizophagus irregularis (strain DAOM 181602 / DAOM 197198 / MUCL 43194) TaxID=747089 RepID=U9TPW6_RHIID